MSDFYSGEQEHLDRTINARVHQRIVADLQAGKYQPGSVEHRMAFDGNLIREIQREHSWDGFGRIKWAFGAAVGAPAAGIYFFEVFNFVSGGKLGAEIPSDYYAPALAILFLFGLTAGIKRGLTPGPLPGVKLSSREDYPEKVYSNFDEKES